MKTADFAAALPGRRVSAHFRQLAGHRSVVVEHVPVGASKAQVLCVPAFGDEMNQTRRMVRLAAEALAGRGIGTTLFDLHGTGDSSAGFENATVERWLDDLATVLDAMRSASAVPVVLFACRLGVALAAELTQRMPGATSALVGWAPLLQGRMQLSAMLRAAKIAQGRRAGADSVDARAAWAAGDIAFLGGYPISPTLAGQLERLDASAAPRVRAATLVDVRPPSPEAAVAPSEALQRRAEAWREQGVEVALVAVEGSPFWNVPDLVDLPLLVDATVDAIEGHLAGRRP